MVERVAQVGVVKFEFGRRNRTIEVRFRPNKRVKYKPNGDAPTFTSPGGDELWKIVLDMHFKMGTMDAKINIIGVLVLGGLGAILARLLGAF